MTPFLKTLSTNIGALIAGAAAMAVFAASNTVDIYAIYAQLNVVWSALLKLVALCGPIVAVGYGAYRTKVSVRVKEIASDPASVKAVEAMPTTPQTAALADALKKNGS